MTADPAPLDSAKQEPWREACDLSWNTYSSAAQWRSIEHEIVSQSFFEDGFRAGYEARDAEVEVLWRHATREYVRGVNDGEMHGPGAEKLAALRRVVEAARAALGLDSPFPLVESVDILRKVADEELHERDFDRIGWETVAAATSSLQVYEAKLTTLRAALAEATDAD